MAPSAGLSVLTYLYLLIYILLSTAVILYNKWVLSPKHFNFPYPIALTMVHMAFCGAVAFVLVSVFKVVEPVKMTSRLYFTSVVPISAFFAGSLWLGNLAMLYLSVAFCQMLKSLMPVATFLVAVAFRTDAPRLDLLLNMVWISAGVAVASAGELQLSAAGAAAQLAGNLSEALRLVLTQLLLQRKGLTLNPITTLYYVAPCSFLFLAVPFHFVERPRMAAAPPVRVDALVFATNALCALALNVAVFLVIGRAGALTVRVASTVKDWLLILLSTLLFHSTLTPLNVGGYAIALAGVLYFNHIRTLEARAKAAEQSAAALLPSAAPAKKMHRDET